MNTIIKNLLFCFMLLILSACDEQNKKTNKEELVPKSPIEQINRQISEVPEDVGVHYYGLEQNLQRYSPLTQINDGNVHQLKPSWVLSLGDNRGQQTQPLVINGVMYITSHNATYAVDARSGRQIWKSTIQYPAETLTCCGVTNRGATWYNDVLYRATPDNRLLALNPKNGKTIWGYVCLSM